MYTLAGELSQNLFLLFFYSSSKQIYLTLTCYSMEYLINHPFLELCAVQLTIITLLYHTLGVRIT